MKLPQKTTIPWLPEENSYTDSVHYLGWAATSCAQQPASQQGPAKDCDSSLLQGQIDQAEVLSQNPVPAI